MTTNYHTAIVNGASVDASTWNTPLGSLDAQVTALTTNNTASVFTAINNGSGEADDTWIVDSTTGFLVGAEISYAVSGTVYTNTIAAINSGVELRVSNTPTVALPNNTVIAQIPPGLSGFISRQIFNVKDAAYGAVGNGATNDYAAIQAAIDAAEAVQGIVYFPPGVYLVNTTPIVDVEGLILQGSTSARGALAKGSVIKSATVNVLQLGEGAANTHHVHVRDLTLHSAAGGGHCLAIGSATGGKVAMGSLQRIIFDQDNSGKSCIHMVQAAAEALTFQEMHVTDCRFMMTAGGIIPGVHMKFNGSQCNNNLWQRLRFDCTSGALNTNATAYAMHFECTNSGTSFYQNTLKDINFQVPHAGCVKLLSCYGFSLENCSAWDLASGLDAKLDDHMWYIGASPTGTRASNHNTLRHCMRQDGDRATDGLYYDIFLEGSAKAAYTMIEKCAGPASDIKHDLNINIATLIGMDINTDVEVDGMTSTALTLLGSEIARLKNLGLGANPPFTHRFHVKHDGSNNQLVMLTENSNGDDLVEIRTGATGAPQLLVAPTAFDMGANQAGALVQIGRNSASNGGPGSVGMAIKTGASTYYLWPDVNGVLRWHTARPTGANDTTLGNRIAGGAQASHIADASVAHDINATFSDTEVEAALDALGSKINSILLAIEAFGITATS